MLSYKGPSAQAMATWSSGSTVLRLHLCFTCNSHKSAMQGISLDLTVGVDSRPCSGFLQGLHKVVYTLQLPDALHYPNSI
jgi:hypothetical protein